MPAVRLVCHPATPCAPLRQVRVCVTRGPAASLRLRYTLLGDLVRVRLPPAAASQPTDGLWRRTCCEAFIAVPEAAGYWEYNFSPSTQWAHYQFSAYRARMRAPRSPPPRIGLRPMAQSLELEAHVRLSVADDLRLRLALCAVIEDQVGALSYWALVHPPGPPNFHHPDSFALVLGPVGGA